MLFPAPIAAELGKLLDQAAAGSQRIEFIIECDDAELIGIPFEAAALPDGRVLSLQPGLRMMRRYRPANAEQQPQGRPLKILVAVGAPDEAKTGSVVLDPEAEVVLVA